MDLMINSIYTHKEVFLREILSNASDAIDKLLFLSLTDRGVGLERGDFEIRITIDKDARTLTVSDNGIGMNEEDLEKNLGVIAASGTFRFKEENGGTEAGLSEEEMIGQFGVGFYSAFMVADRITVLTKKYGETAACRWESEGASGYTVEEAEKETVGTDVVMHLREDDEGNDYSQYLNEYTIRSLVKKYSDYIRFPIRMNLPHTEKKADSPEDKPEYETVYREETVNSMQPLWQRPSAEVTEEEYNRFYSDEFMDPTAPMSVITTSVEGNVTYKALLFIPAKVPGLYMTEDYEPGLQLYSAGVKIMDKCPDLLPSQFNFVKGVVDSPDLSLNISRELLQHDRQLKVIQKNLARKVKGELEGWLKNDREKYEKFWQNFGRQLKVSCLEDYGVKSGELKDLLLFASSKTGGLVTLKEYTEAMPEDQKHIYFATGDSVDAIDRLPQTEIVKKHDYAILYFTDKADEFLADLLREYEGKTFCSVLSGDLGIEDEQKPDDSGIYQDTFAFIKETLGGRVDEVKESARLISHPVSLSSGEGLTFEMEKYFKAVQPELDMKAKRILELNTDHEAFKKIDILRTTDPEKAKKYAEILYNQACLIAGLPIADPSGYTDLLCSLFTD